MRNQLTYGIAVVVTAGGLLLSACGDDDAENADDASEPGDDGGATDPAEGDASIEIIEFAFSPQDLTVAAGAEISITNDDTAPHTYTSEDGGFDSGTLTAEGGEGTVTAPDDPDTYEVICTIHPSITGTLTVES